MIFLNICVEERGLDLPPYPDDTGLNRQVEDVFTFLKFIVAHEKIASESYAEVSLLTSEAKHDLNQCEKRMNIIKQKVK